MALPNQSGEQMQAIALPQNGQHNVEVLIDQPRQPRNLQGLLKFAMEATKAQDAQGNSNLCPLNEERRRYLDEAFRSLTVDVIKILHDTIKVLTTVVKIRTICPDDEIPSEVNEAFETLTSVVDDMDIANDFFKLGGFTVFAVCYGCDHPGVKAQASNLLAEICQNNPFCQAKVLECGLFGILVNILEYETHHQLLIKSLYALSAIVRDFTPSHELFLQTNGCAALVKCLSSTAIPLRTKAAFLISYLCNHNPDAKRLLLKAGLVNQLISALSEGRNDCSENLLGALRSVVSENEVMEQCRDPQLRLKQILEDHLKHPELVDYIEEKNYCQEILTEVFGTS